MTIRESSYNIPRAVNSAINNETLILEIWLYLDLGNIIHNLLAIILPSTQAVNRPLFLH